MSQKRRILSPDELSFIPVSAGLRNSVLQLVFASGHKSMDEVKQERQVTDLKKILELLSDVAKNPFKTLTARRNLSFGNSTSDLFRVKDKARKIGCAIQVITKATRGPGQKGIYLELTRKGVEFLIENRLWKKDKPYYSGKMGFSGALLIHGLLIPHFEERGLKALIEGINKGYDCDIGIIGDDNSLEIAIELSVFTSAKQELVNIRRDIESGWKRIISVVVFFERKDDEMVENELKTREKAKSFFEYFSIHLSLDELNRIEIRCISEFRKKANNER